MSSRCSRVTWCFVCRRVCHLLGSHRFELEIPARGRNIPEFRRAQGSTRMDTVAQFRRMTERRAPVER